MSAIANQYGKKLRLEIATIIRVYLYYFIGIFSEKLIIMRKPRSRFILLALALLVAFTSWQCARVVDQSADSPSPSPVASPALVALTDEPVEPLPLAVPVDFNQVALGKKLFHDKMLSGDNTLSCATCHDLAKGGTDQLTTSVGIKNSRVPINSPTVLNSGFQFKQFWDGRAESLEVQAGGPIMADIEMGSSSWEQVIAELSAVPDYVSAFNDAYPDGITETNIRDAIAEYERTLITPNSPFDKFLKGEDDALTNDEKEGYRRFKSSNCASCHSGILLGGNSFQKMGAFGDYFGDRGNITEADYGRFNVTGDEADRFSFKVPTLRNVALTFPYFHDGSAETLEDAVSVMLEYQVGQDPDPEDVKLITAFLKTLTGENEEIIASAT